jgi:predicted RNA-binding Zn-ribbon protein involved in translation (DUF1610 family)
VKVGSRSSERWFNRALWLVALAFAWFLTALGSLIVGDLPQVEQHYTLEQFLDRDRAVPTAEALREVRRDRQENQRRVEQAELELEAARSASAAARETFSNWLKTRDATQRVDQDPGLVSRTERLDTLKEAERTIETRLEGLAREGLDLSERAAAQERVETEIRTDAAERRHTRNWPFIWGFAFFAAFAFFVELVPYLPSYGGYVQYGVGVIVTLIAGRAAINAFQAYLSRQKEAEARPNEERRTEIATDQALAHLAKKVCPGCERSLDLTDPNRNFCPHCGIGAFERCVRCEQRKSTFDRLCHACGEPTPTAAVRPA